MMSSDGAPRAHEIGVCAAMARNKITTTEPGHPRGRVQKDPRLLAGSALGDRGLGNLGGDFGHLGGRAPHAHPAGFERLGLGGGGALRAAHDRARVAHRLAGRRREAGDVSHHGLRDVVCDELGCQLLLLAADLAAHHDHVRLGIGLEEGDHVDERGAGHRGAADAGDRGVTEAALGQLVADLVGERPGPRHHAHVALGEEVRGDDPHIGLAWREHAGAIGADQARGFAALDVRVHAQHVVHWDALGDAHDQGNPGLRRLEDRVGRKAGRHEDHRGVGAGLVHGVADRVEHRDALHVEPALPGRYARPHVGAVAPVVEAVEASLAAGPPGDDELRPLVHQDAHAASSTTRSAAPSIVSSTNTFGRSASARIRRPSSSLVPSRRTKNGTCTSTRSNASTRPRATSSQRVMPPKMLNSTAVTFSSERITSTASTIASAFEPPPASRKFAGRPPAWATTSSVDMTRPAPLPRMPTFPSSFTYVSPRSFAICSCGSSSPTLRKAATSGWRCSALPSTVTLASSATTWRSLVTSSGLTSTSIASSAMKVSYSRASSAPAGRITSAAMPDSNASRRPWKSWKPSSGSTWRRTIAVGSRSAISSTSMPPIRESITIGARALRSKTIAA